MSSTRFVPAWACWSAYATALFAIYLTFRLNPLGDDEHLGNGLLAHTLATCVIWLWSFSFSNTSIYDPAWCWFPIALGIGWIAGSKDSGGISTRGTVALCLLFAWCLRYSWQFPWAGWTTGIDREDWRYVEIAKKTGSGTPLYWLASLFSLHLTPTWLVFAALSPVERVWSDGVDGTLPLFHNKWDALGIGICISAILIQHSADNTLFRFRAKAYGTTTNLDHLSSSKTICREGLWKWSLHPNYFGESFFWLGLGCLACGGEGGWSAPSVSGSWKDIFRAWSGSVIMFCFFRVSCYMTDQRMLANRGDAYRKVMEEVSPLIPFFTWLP